MIDKDDHKAFEEATRDVKKLKRGNRVEAQTPRPSAKATRSRAADAATLEESLHGTLSESTGEDLAFRRPNVSEYTFRQLRRGKFSIEDEIDLHGLTKNQAKAALKDFIAETARRQLGCVRVVHGKGMRSGPEGPVLKRWVPHWLSRWNAVLAFCAARVKHGGDGAIYVLLRPR